MLQYADHTVAPLAPMQERDEPLHQPSAAEAALLVFAEPSLDSRISLIGPNTLESLYALHRHGNADVSASWVSDWSQAGTADVAIVPRAGSPDCLGRAIAHLVT